MSNHTTPLKHCSKCKQEFPATTEYFNIRKDSKDGLRGYCRACHARYARQWDKAHPERAAETNRAYRIANRERAAEKAARHRAKHPDRTAARVAVSNAVKLGKLPAASTQVCIVCGKPAKNWHHYLGYAREHRLDVIAACGMCHIELDKEVN